MKKLADYHKKRHFDKTAEPAGTAERSSKKRFVIQKHAATRLHYDLRLEVDGVMKSWAVPKGATPDERPSGVATVEDGSVFVAFARTGRIEKYSSDGTWITSWIATENAAEGSHSIAGFAVTDDFVFTLTVSPSQIRVWTIDGQHKLDADLGEHLGTIAAPQIAVTPHAELLVFDPSAPRVFMFRMHLETKESK